MSQNIGNGRVRLVGRRTRTAFAVVAAAASFAVVGCNDSDENTAPLVATTVSVNTSSDAQTGVAGQALANPISVHVVDQNGDALGGAVVTWAPASGNGSVASATSTTNASGDATVVWTIGNAVGANSLVASIASGSQVTITATGTAGAFSSLVLSSGDAQTVTVGGTSAALVVKAVDANGNPVAGATVAWAVTGGGTLSAASATTDASGMASVTLTTDAAPATYTVTATSGTATPVTFTVTGAAAN